MEEQLAQLLIELESTKLRLLSVENALINLVGFYIPEEGSEAGRIAFGLNVGRISPQAKVDI